MDQLKKKVVFSSQEIQDRVRQLGVSISNDFRGGELVVIGVLKGAFIFLADLVRYLDVPCKIDFIRACSYGACSTSSGEVKITKDIEIDISDRDVRYFRSGCSSGGGYCRYRHYGEFHRTGIKGTQSEFSQSMCLYR